MHGVIRALSLFDSEPLKVAELGSSDERFGKTTLKEHRSILLWYNRAVFQLEQSEANASPLRAFF